MPLRPPPYAQHGDKQIDRHENGQADTYDLYGEEIQIGCESLYMGYTEQREQYAERTPSQRHFQANEPVQIKTRTAVIPRLHTQSVFEYGAAEIFDHRCDRGKENKLQCPMQMPEQNGAYVQTDSAEPVDNAKRAP